MKRTYLTNPIKPQRRSSRKAGQRFMIEAFACTRAEAKALAPARKLRFVPFTGDVAFAALGDPTWTERDEQELLRYNAGPLPL